MDHEITFIEHLSELRGRIIVCLVAVGIASVACMSFAPHVLKILRLPTRGMLDKLVFFSPEEAFLIYMRLGLFCGLIFSMPVILYQVWSFCSPAMEEKMRKYSIYFIISCFTVFILGGLFAYFIVIPSSLRFCLSFGRDELEPIISASKYISFITTLIIGCGLVFQMPILSFLLAKLGIIDAMTLRKKYKYAIVVIFIAAAVITPTTDVFNMLILSLPMLLLYELSIWIAKCARMCQQQSPQKLVCKLAESSGQGPVS